LPLHHVVQQKSEPAAAGIVDIGGAVATSIILFVVVGVFTEISGFL
jgi:hypothetical protein